MFIRWESSKLQQPHSIGRMILEENFSWEQGHELVFSLQLLQPFSKHMDNARPAICGPAPQGQPACLSLRRLPRFAVCITLSRPCDHCRFCWLSKKIGGWGCSPLDWEAVCISRQSNKRSAHFSLSKFSHHFLLSLLSSLASEDDISTPSSRLSLAFPLSPLPGSSIFHPPWCLSAQRAASRLSSPKQAAFVSGPLESHRSHLGSLIFFFKTQD